MKKKAYGIISVVLILVIAVSLSAGAVGIADFSDVAPSDWYYDAVDNAVSRGMFYGTSATTFSPNTSMSRGMFITVLGRIAEVPDSYGRLKPTPFNDVTQADYSFPYAVWANDNGLVADIAGNSFSPNAEITREQMATILFRYAGQPGYDFTYSDERYYIFPDTASVSDYAVDAMMWTTTHGVINGMDGMLCPQDSATRAQVAQIFLNFSGLEPSDLSDPTEPKEPMPDWENYHPVYVRPIGKSAADANGGYYDYDLANEIMDQVNTLRVNNGVDALLYHPKIQDWTSVRAKEQTICEGHTRPDGTIFSTVGKGLTTENITIMRNCTASERNNIPECAARAVNSWYTSTKGHKEAMLSSAPHLGAVACYVKGNTVCVVQLFSNKTLYFMDYLI